MVLHLVFHLLIACETIDIYLKLLKNVKKKFKFHLIKYKEW